MIKVQLNSIRQSAIHKYDLLIILEEIQGERYFPFWVSKKDGAEIILAIAKRNERPIRSHALMAEFIKFGKIKIDGIYICDVNDALLYAKILINPRGLFGDIEEIDCNLADALNIAIRFNAPIYILDSVMEKHAISESKENLAGEVFYGVRIQEQDEIKAQEDEFDYKSIYATQDLERAVAFLSVKGGEYTCSVGRNEETGKVFICERSKGAFDLRYASVEGVIYVLPGEKFQERDEQWVSSDVIESTIQEIYIPDAKDCLQKLANEGKLEILYYPEKGTYFPEDDEDLVMKATLSYQQSGERIFKLLEEYQPGLLSRVNQAIEEKRYAGYENRPTPRGV